MELINTGMPLHSCRNQTPRYLNHSRPLKTATWTGQTWLNMPIWTNRRWLEIKISYIELQTTTPFYNPITWLKIQNHNLKGRCNNDTVTISPNNWWITARRITIWIIKGRLSRRRRINCLKSTKEIPSTMENLQSLRTWTEKIQTTYPSKATSWTITVWCSTTQHRSQVCSHQIIQVWCQALRNQDSR